MQDRGQLGRELERIVESVRSRPIEVQRSAAIHGIEPERHSRQPAPAPAPEPAGDEAESRPE